MLQNLGVEATSTQYNVNGLTLHVIEAGPKDGPAVILLHGFPEFWWAWREQIAPLAKAGFRVIVPDQRGYNLSDKPQDRKSYDLDLLTGDIVGLADLLGIRTFDLVGHDWGALVSWWLATTYPERVNRLVVINAPHPSALKPYMKSHPKQWLKSSYAMFYQLPGLPEALLRAKNYQPLKNGLKSSARPGAFTDEDLAIYQEAWDRPGALTAMLNWYRAIPLTSGKPFKARVSVPVLIIWGKKDSFMESGIVEECLKLCDNGRVRWLEDTTHWVHLEEPEILRDELANFLKR